MGDTMNGSIETHARREARIVLVMDQDMADFYIDLLEQNAWIGLRPDVGVQDDLKYLRRQYEVLWDTDD